MSVRHEQGDRFFAPHTLFAALVAGVAFPVTDYFAGELEGLWIPTWNFVVRSGRSQPSPD